MFAVFPRFEHSHSLLAKSELGYNGLSRICIHKWKDIPAFILFGKVSILGKVENLKKTQKAAYPFFKNDSIFRYTANIWSVCIEIEFGNKETE